MMETTKQGMDTVRARARSQRQHTVRLSKPEEAEGLERQSLQKIRTLKSLEQDANQETEDALLAEVSMFDRMWDWFQRSIGNR